RLWDPTTGQARGTLSGTLLGFVGSPPRLAVYAEGKVRFWDAAATPLKEAQALPAAGGWALALSPDGKTLALETDTHAVRLWDLGGAAPRERAVLEGHTSALRRAAFSADGRLMVTSSYDQTVRLWDLGGDRPRERAVLRDQPTRDAGLALAPDGRL